MLTRGGEVVARTDICAYVRVSTKDKEQLSSFENQMSYGQLRVDGSEQGVQIVQRPIQLLCDPGGEAFQCPCDVPIMLQHLPGVVVHVLAQCFVGAASLFVGDLLIRHDPLAL